MTWMVFTTVQKHICTLIHIKKLSLSFGLLSLSGRSDPHSRFGTCFTPDALPAHQETKLNYLYL